MLIRLASFPISCSHSALEHMLQPLVLLRHWHTNGCGDRGRLSRWNGLSELLLMAEKSPAEEPLLKVIEGDHGSGSATQRTVITAGPSSSSGGGGGADKSFSVLAGNGAYLQQHSHHLPPPPSHLQTTQSANSSPRVETIVEPRATVQSQSLPDFRTTSTPSISMDPNVPGPSGLPGSNSQQWTSEPGLQCGE